VKPDEGVVVVAAVAKVRAKSSASVTLLDAMAMASTEQAVEALGRLAQPTRL
jgi:hypothetical protein